ncbi:hypothetical protein [Ferruginibacter sp. SUN106]|uniref:hypothetical protein n=1 Tax=Ferruginibacter sp. SUN106 TaxID=2978348 RepID=UPI003D3600AE
MTRIQVNILQTLAYFDIFHYPLTNEEIRNFLSISTSQAAVDEQLVLLVENKSIYKLDEFYSLQNNIAIASRRRNGNIKAIAEIQKAGKAARILSKFPFVEGLALSGSLSKNFADDNTDIDFFIIAKTNRLWIARTIMHLFYKLAKLAGKQNWFCMNYYVDEAGMEIEEKNIFTAMEIITLVPMEGLSRVNNFMYTNKWVQNYFPGYKAKNTAAQEIKKGWPRSFAEMLLNGKLGDSADNWLMKITARRWKKKERQLNLNAKGICMGMLAEKHFAKPDPKNFQFKILEQYDSKVDQILYKQNKSLLAAK